MKRLVRVRPLLALALAAAAAGCLSTPPPDPAQEEALRSASKLSDELLDVADFAAATFGAATSNLFLGGATDQELMLSEAVRNNSVAFVRAICLDDDPARALVDLLVYAKLAAWACENRKGLPKQAFEEDCGRTYGALLGEVERVAKEWMTPDQIAVVDQAVEGFKKRSPGRTMIGLIRLPDLAVSSDVNVRALQASAPSLLSPVTEAATQIQLLRMLGGRLLWLLGRLPQTISWRGEELISAVLASDGFAAIRDSLTAIGANLKETQEDLSALREPMTGLAGAVQAMGATLDRFAAALSQVGERLDRTEQRLASVEPKIESLYEAVADVGRSIEKTGTAIDSISSTGQILSSNVASLTATMDRLAQRIDSLDQRIAAAEGSQQTIDGILVRAGAIGAILIILAGIGRFVVHHLTKPKTR